MTKPKANEKDHQLLFSSSNAPVSETTQLYKKSTPTKKQQALISPQQSKFFAEAFKTVNHNNKSNTTDNLISGEDKRNSQGYIRSSWVPDDL